MDMLPHFRKYYRFESGDEPLLQYLYQQKDVDPPIVPGQRLFTLMDLIFYVRRIVLAPNGNYVDLLNPEMILCDPDLEKALKVKSFHIRQLTKLIKAQVTETSFWIDYRTYPQVVIDGLRLGSEAMRRRYYDHVTRRQMSAVEPTFEEMYVPNPLLHTLLFPQDVNVGQAYSYSDILSALVRYFHAHQNLIVEGNPSVVFIQEDPLCAALGGVTAFHSDQTENILKKNMVLESVVLQDL